MEITHYIQLQILKELLYLQNAKFTQLNTTNVSNDHFTFHLKQLVKLGFVSKNNEYYSLTPKGKELAGRINPLTGQTIVQPKVGVTICVIREINGRKQVLLGKRLRDQSKDEYGFYTVKVQKGEPLEEVCKRGLFEETGLEANFEYKGTLRIIRREDDEIEIDVIDVCFLATDITGDLIEQTDECINSWFDFDEALKLEKTFIGFKEDLQDYLKDGTFFKERITSK